MAVSKLKPANDILALHCSASGGAPPLQTDFGENYAQELAQKAALLPASVRWHFIGGLQSGHCRQLGRNPRVWCVASVDSAKKARLLDKARGEIRAGAAAAEPAPPAGEGTGKEVAEQTAEEGAPEAEPPVERLRVRVQVNTSGEASKSGVSPGPDTTALCRAIVTEMPNLRLVGLMTIGAIARSKATTPETENEDFVVLRQERDRVVEELGLAADGGLELSMGMSDDFEGAVSMGSDEVRIGSTIFGERPAKADAKVVA